MIRLRPSEVFDKLNPDQRQSLDWTRSISIRANAGSGKTSVLIQRIIQILHHACHHSDNLRLDHIVAITFTRKAAAQLRQKLRDTLALCAGESTGVEQAYWQARLDELPTCPIGTIDSVCHRILHQAINEGMIDDLDPNFGILQGIDRRELLDRAIERTEQFIDADPAARDAWLHWLTTQGRSETVGAVRRLLGSPVSPEDCERALNARLKQSENAVVELLDLESVRFFRGKESDCRKRLTDVLADLNRLPMADRSGKHMSETIERVAEILASPDQPIINRLGQYRVALLTKDGGLKKSGFNTKTGPKSQLFHDLTQEWHPYLTNWKLDFPDQDGLDLARQLILIYKQAHQHFHNLCREENHYDFNYLAEESIKILKIKKNADRLTGFYRYVLVDEFQDTNELHWQIVARVAGEDPAKPVQSRKLMIVGDPQQSIYRFRQADPTVFSRVIELIKRGNQEQNRQVQQTAFDQHQHSNGLKADLSSDSQRLGEMKLAKNYRSHDPLPIKLLDSLSLHAFREVGFEYQRLEAGNTKKGDFTEVVYLVPQEENEETFEETAEDGSEAKDAPPSLSEQQVELVAGELRRLHSERGFEWKQMAILLRSRATHLKTLETILREQRIPYQLLGGLGFWQRQEVRDLVSLVQCLANGSDDLALFAVLRGPLIGLDDSELLFLATLGGRHLGKGLQRVEQLLAGEETNSLILDEPTATALKQAWAQIGEARRTVLRIAAGRLGSSGGTWRQRVDRIPHAELMRLALVESHAWAVYASGDEGDRSLANLRLLLDEVSALEADRPGSLAETARRLKLLVDEVDDEEQAELDAPAGNAVQIMTVHAAKGLEFPVVAVVGLERQYKSDSTDVWLLDRFQHLTPTCRDTELAKQLHGLPIVRFRDPEKPLETVKPLLHQAISSVEKRLMIAEEARIFHVAITRAERVLLLAGGANPKSNTWQRWVYEALGLDKNPAEGPHQVDGLTIRIVRNAIQAASTDEPAEQPPLVLDLQPLLESPRRRTIAATSLFTMIEKYEEKPEEWQMHYRHYVQPHVGALPRGLLGEATPKREIGWLIGTLVHRALEMGDAFPKDIKIRRQFLIAQAAALTRAPSGNLDEPGDNPDDLIGVQLDDAVATAGQILTKVLPNNPFKGLLEAPGDSEVDFSLKLGDWTIVGRFDRLIQVADVDWEIVDWKTDDEPATDIVERYQNQMKLYALALYRSLREKPPTSIVVHLAMTKHQKTERLEFTADHIESFERELVRRLPAFR